MLGAAALLLSACSEGQVTHPTPAATLPVFNVPTLPPIGYNHRYGNSPLAAADAFAMERSLFSIQQYWEVALRDTPVEPGNVNAADPQALKSARAGITSVLMVIASESLPTLRALLLRGDGGQKAYFIDLVGALRAEGYTGLTNVSVLVYFGEQDHHATLSWTPETGYSYTIFDNDLNGRLTKPLPSSTPFTSVSTPVPTPAH